MNPSTAVLPSLLITRPAADAALLARQLQALGVPVLCDAMLHIEPQAGAQAMLNHLKSDRLAALVTTSKHALEAIGQLHHLRHLPVFTAGNASAKAARARGFMHVSIGHHGAADMAAAIRRQISPKDGVLLYLRGLQISQPLQALLPEYSIQEIITYRARASESLSPHTQEALGSGQISGVGFFSRRSATTFEKLAAGIDLSACRAICISSAIADALDGRRWGHIVVVNASNADAFQAALLQT